MAVSLLKLAHREQSMDKRNHLVIAETGYIDVVILDVGEVKKRATELIGMYGLVMRIFLVFLVSVVVFIAAGAVLFSIWEEWKLFDGAYFCFVTLTTIGRLHIP